MLVSVKYQTVGCDNFSAVLNESQADRTTESPVLVAVKYQTVGCDNFTEMFSAVLNENQADIHNGITCFGLSEVPDRGM